MQINDLTQKCCLTCQYSLEDRTLSIEEGSSRVLITDATEALCTHKKHLNEKMPLTFSCFYYKRWNAIELELEKAKNRRDIHSDNVSYERNDQRIVSQGNKEVEEKDIKEESTPQDNPTIEEHVKNHQEDILNTISHIDENGNIKEDKPNNEDFRNGPYKQPEDQHPMDSEEENQKKKNAKLIGRISSGIIGVGFVIIFLVMIISTATDADFAPMFLISFVPSLMVIVFLINIIFFIVSNAKKK